MLLDKLSILDFLKNGITKFENFELKSYVSFWKLRNKHFLTEILINFDRVLMIYSMKIVLIFFASYFCIK